MENAVDALKIAFAIFVFVLAITVAFSLISQAKSTADVVLYHSDKTNFYEHLNSKEINREVSVSEVISTLYKYYNESIAVTVKLGNEEYVFDSGRETVVNINSDTSVKLNTDALKEQNLANFINAILLKKYADTKFTEEFVEAPISGIYQTGEDDTEIILSSGGKKVYITYTAK